MNGSNPFVAFSSLSIGDIIDQIEATGLAMDTDIQMNTNVKITFGSGVSITPANMFYASNAFNVNCRDGEVMHFNERGDDQDFQFSTPSQTNLLYINSTRNNIGIGTSSVADCLLGFAAGTTSVVPFRMAAGTNSSTIRSGAFEWDGKINPMFASDSSSRRFMVVGGENLGGTVSLSNTVTETTMLSFTIESNTIRDDQVIRLVIHGKIKNNGATDTITFKAKRDSTTESTLGPLTLLNTADSAIRLEYTFTVRTIGSGGTFIGQLDFLGPLGYSGSVATNTTSINTTADRSIVLTAQWNNASANNVLTFHQAYVQFL